MNDNNLLATANVTVTGVIIHDTQNDFLKSNLIKLAESLFYDFLCITI